MRGSRTRTCCRWSTPASFRRRSASVPSRNSGRSCMTSSPFTRRCRCDPTVRSPGPCAKMRRRSRRSSTISSSSTARARCSATCLLQRYLGSVKRLENPTSAEGSREVSSHGAAFPHLRRPIRLRLAVAIAQGYQESQLDHSRRSSAGCGRRHADQAFNGGGSQRRHRQRGNLENNIHASIKYMSFLRDRYFADEGIDPLDQGLLTLAAYNAGPARVAELRQKAAAVGLDRNQVVRQRRDHRGTCDRPRDGRLREQHL